VSLFLDLLDGHVRANPQRAAICQGDLTLSYAELWRAASESAARFAAAGVSKRDRVLLTISNLADDVIAILALARIEALPLLVSASATEGEVQHARLEFRPRWIIGGDGVSRCPLAGTQEGEPGFCLLTSGVSGAPKIVATDWTTSLVVVRNWLRAFCNDDGERVLCTTPICHSYGLCVGLLGPLSTGSTVVLLRGPVTAGALCQAVRRHRVTIVQSVPVYYRVLCHVPADRLESVRLCISAGEALSADTRRRWRAALAPQLCDHYGASEVGQVSIDLEDVDGSVGRPAPGCEVSIRTASNPSPDGTVWIRAAGRPCRYLGAQVDGDPSQNDGWFRTGDRGYLDAAGRLIITGRVISQINVGGHKVDRSEVEQAILSFPGVVDCAVVGQPSTWAGEQVCAFVSGAAWDPSTLAQFLRSHLSGFKVPTTIKRVDAIPRTLSGKIRYGVIERW